MLLDTDRARLRHMIDAAEQALAYAKDCGRADLDGNPPLQHLFIRDIEILGEAAGRISPGLQARHPDIPWRELVGMRNRLIHKYFDVDLDIVWNTVQQVLPALLPRFRAMLGEENGS